MNTRIIAIMALPLIASASGLAESLPVYFGTYTGGDSSSKGIYHSMFDTDTGKLSEPRLVAEIANPSFIETHKGGPLLYAVSEAGGAGTVSAYLIDEETGDLEFLNRQPSGGAGPCHISIDNHLFVANYGSGSASVIPIQRNGKLAKPTCVVQHEGSSINPRRQKGPHAHSINVSPDSRYAYVADLGIDKIMIYRCDADKAVLISGSVPYVALPPGAGPRHFAFHPDKKHAYVINELNCTITAFLWNEYTGALTPIQTITTLPSGYDKPNTCAEICVHPNGRFLYGSNRGHDSIAVYQVDPADGKLTLVEHETQGIATPRNYNIAPEGQFCLVANQSSDSVVVFRIDQETGALEPTGQKIAVGKPVCIRFWMLSMLDWWFPPPKLGPK